MFGEVTTFDVSYEVNLGTCFHCCQHTNIPCSHVSLPKPSSLTFSQQENNPLHDLQLQSQEQLQIQELLTPSRQKYDMISQI